MIRMKTGKPTSALWDSFTYWFGRRSLQSRLIAAYIFIILGPSLLVSFYSYRAINSTYVRDAIEKNSTLLEMERLYIDTQIESMVRAAQVAYDDLEIRDYLSNTSEPDAEELVEFNNNDFKNMTRILYYNPNVEHMRLYSKSNGNEIWPIFFRESRVATEGWYQKAIKMRGSESWSLQYNDPDLMKRYLDQSPALTPKISLLRELSIPANNHVGMVQVDMLLEKFTPRAYSMAQNGQSQMILIDEDMQIFTRGEHSFLAENEAMGAAIKSRLQAFGENGNWDIHYSENGKSFLLINIPIDRIHANLLNVVSMDGVLQEISHTRNLIIGANIVFVTLVTAIAYVMNAFILKNLRLLTDAMKKVRRGEAYGGFTIRGGGEVGELAHHFSKLMNTINTLVAQAVHKQALTKEAELRTLHNQIDAHFLYNTLENIKMLAEVENQRQISDALTSLGGMMRYNFKWSGEYVKLRDEIRHIENYIEVMNIRFEYPIALILDIEHSYMELEVLKMSLQPIVENSVKHAWPGDAAETENRNICIEISESEGKIAFAVTDNGSGLSQDRLNALHEVMKAEEPVVGPPGTGAGARRAGGIGLRNVHQRLRLFYGEEYGLEVQSEAGNGTTVFMTLPKVLLTGDKHT
ncbi:sensor histidine kinase [Paenibacillus sp. sgz500958]|uniref:sensor histidine kinase n=1 Tax=Paenibacillus sp. sgz500958 TaxID=3242475 RepID=UPI0036D30B17